MDCAFRTLAGMVKLGEEISAGVEEHRMPRGPGVQGKPVWEEGFT